MSDHCWLRACRLGSGSRKTSAIVHLHALKCAPLHYPKCKPVQPALVLAPCIMSCSLVTVTSWWWMGWDGRDLTISWRIVKEKNDRVALISRWPALATWPVCSPWLRPLFVLTCGQRLRSPTWSDGAAAGVRRTTMATVVLSCRGVAAGGTAAETVAPYAEPLSSCCWIPALPCPSMFARFHPSDHLTNHIHLLADCMLEKR